MLSIGYFSFLVSTFAVDKKLMKRNRPIGLWKKNR